MSTGCSDGSSTSQHDFVDEVVNLTIRYANDEFVQFPGLYSELADNIPEDKDENLMLVSRLKEREFEVTNWGRGNMPPLGPRVVEIELKKDDCICRVSKMYYSTSVDTLYHIVEGIHCSRD